MTTGGSGCVDLFPQRIDLSPLSASPESGRSATRVCRRGIARGQGLLAVAEPASAQDRPVDADWHAVAVSDQLDRLTSPAAMPGLGRCDWRGTGIDGRSESFDREDLLREVRPRRDVRPGRCSVAGSEYVDDDGPGSPVLPTAAARIHGRDEIIRRARCSTRICGSFYSARCRSGRSGDAGLPGSGRDVAVGRLSWLAGQPGHGRALGVGEVGLHRAEVLPTAKKVTTASTSEQIHQYKLVLGIADVRQSRVARSICARICASACSPRPRASEAPRPGAVRRS